MKIIVQTHQLYLPKILAPKINTNTKSTIKIKNNTLAMLAAPSAIPPKPNIAATIEMTRKIAAHFSIEYSFKKFR